MAKLSVIGALMGMGLGIWTVSTCQHPPSVHPDRPPSINPYPQGIAASGLVEAAGGNIRIAAPEPGLVAEVFVEVNDSVKTGDPLFQLDARQVKAELCQAEAAVGSAQRNLQRLEAMPREEDLPPLRAAVEHVTAQLKYAEIEYDRFRRLHDKRAASDSALSLKLYQVNKATTALAEQRAQLARLEAGAWEPDLNLARSTLEQAKADLQVNQSRIDRITVRSPIDGVVLKRFVAPGEFVRDSTGPAFIVGNLSELHVRAGVDERDTPFLAQGARATAFVTGRKRHEFNMQMLRIEPLAVPKAQLTGSDVELVDTRVVEVVFQVACGNKPNVRLYPGQIVDVFIETKE